MLVITAKEGEGIQCGPVTFHFLRGKNGRFKVGIEAPPEVNFGPRSKSNVAENGTITGLGEPVSRLRGDDDSDTIAEPGVRDDSEEEGDTVEVPAATAGTT